MPGTLTEPKWHFLIVEMSCMFYNRSLLNNPLDKTVTHILNTSWLLKKIMNILPIHSLQHIFADLSVSSFENLKKNS